MKLEFSGQILEEYSNTEFHENLSSGSRVVPCGRTDMTKLFAIFLTRLKAYFVSERKVSASTLLLSCNKSSKMEVGVWNTLYWKGEEWDSVVKKKL
jgi:hypothetical protein